MHWPQFPGKYLLFLAVTALPQSSHSAIDSHLLISSCEELVAIYDRRGKERFLAGISTSVAEAMRAGICRGMLEEHSRHSGYCPADWYEQALYIGALINTKPKHSVEQILDRACKETTTK